jgi:hypothetical protein
MRFGEEIGNEKNLVREDAAKTESTKYHEISPFDPLFILV